MPLTIAGVALFGDLVMGLSLAAGLTIPAALAQPVKLGEGARFVLHSRSLNPQKAFSGALDIVAGAFREEQALRIDHPHVLAPASWAADDDDATRKLLEITLVQLGRMKGTLFERGPALLDELEAHGPAILPVEHPLHHPPSRRELADALGAEAVAFEMARRCALPLRAVVPRHPLTALVDQFYADVQALGGRRWDTSSLIKRLR